MTEMSTRGGGRSRFAPGFEAFRNVFVRQFRQNWFDRLYRVRDLEGSKEFPKEGVVFGPVWRKFASEKVGCLLG